jgi:hypothetical protein
MASSQRIDRKLFLTWALSSTSAAALGCSDASTDTPANTGGAGGSAGGGTAGTFTTGGSAAGTFNNAGAAGTTPVAGSGGSAGGAAGASGAAGAGGSAGAGGAGPMPNCGTQLKVTITSNHGHVLNVSLEDVMAGVDKAYDTKGTSMHDHWVRLTAADFTKLKSGGTVRKATCNDGHEHEYIVNCIGVDKPETTSGIANYCDADHMCAGTMGNYCPEIP